MAQDGPHCHLDNQSKETRRNSIAEELKAKIASVSRRNSWSGSRRGSSTMDSRRGSIQSIKEDPICEEVCDSLKEGAHCHLEEPEQKTEQTSVEDPTCTKARECEETVNGEHCHVAPLLPSNDQPDGQQTRDDNDDHDVISTNSQPDNSSADKNINLQTISPAEAVESAEAHSNESTPLTARRGSQTPVNMKEKESLGVEQSCQPVVPTMPPTEHQPQNIENIVASVTQGKDSQPAEKNERITRAQSRTISRSRSKSRATSPNSERKSRLSSKERKSK